MSKYNKVKLLIAIPSVDYVHFKFSESLSKLMQWLTDNGVNYRVEFRGGTLLYMSRDYFVDLAYKWSKGFTHVLWLDSDMVFEPDIFERLYNDDKDMVCGLFRGRHGKKNLCIFKQLLPANRFEIEDVNEFKGQIFEVAGCGFGCVLTTVKLLEAVATEYGSSFMPTKQMGEDVAFCDRVGKLGYKIFCDPMVHVGHISQSIIWPVRSEQVI